MIPPEPGELPRGQIIEAELTWVGNRFEPNIQVMVRDDGVIEQVGLLDMHPTLRLPERALMPGMVNAHSHAFQRGLRGFGESYPRGAGSFWTWRDVMYELVGWLDGEAFRNLAHIAFEEMLRCGITTVGEFHYFHHGREDADFSLDQAILEAARLAGLRIVLLVSHYSAGGIGEPLSAEQKRFDTGSVDAFLEQVDALRRHADCRMQRIGLSAHSVRAVPADDLARLAEYARAHEMVLHVHADEQRQEIEQCERAFDCTPVQLLAEKGVLGDRTTLVHCTHTSASDLQLIAEQGARVCLCPTTEGNLADGIADVPSMKRLGAPICLGTDSNLRICMLEEMRWLEYVQRVRREARGIVVDGDGDCAMGLWEAATINGAAALGIPAGRIAPGCHADFAAVDIRGLSLLGATATSLLPAYIFGSGRCAVTHTCVGGEWHHWDKSRSQQGVRGPG